MGARFDGTTYAIKDDAEVIEFFANTWAKCSAADVAHDVLSNTALWSGKDLTEVAGLEDAVTKHLMNMETTNMKDLVASL